MLLIEDWVIDADDRCYILGRLKTRTNKNGEAEQYIHNARYFTRLSDALNAILETEKRKIVRNNDLSPVELLAEIRKIDQRLIAHFKELEGDRYT